MFNKFLIVCTANICRSPMAEFMLREKLEHKSGVVVASAGVSGLVGKPADENVITVLNDKGIDASAHVAQQLTQALIEEFDLILPVEKGHQRWIEQTFPVAVGRVQRLGRWRDTDIPDPYRRGLPAFEATYELINECIDDWVSRIG